MSDPSKTPPPDWAVQYGRGAVRIGMSVPEIEQHLVSKGLSPEAAKNLVLDIVTENLRQEAPKTGSDEFNKPVRLLPSLVMGAACFGLAYWFWGERSAAIASVWVVPALLSIWVPVLTETDDSDWGVKSWFFGWAVLLLYLGSRIFFAIMWR
jgi:hypothetical protein